MDPAHKFTGHFNIVITWQLKNVIFPLSEGLCTPNVAGWWLRMREPHLQSHVKYRSRGRVSSQNVLSPHLQGPWSPKLVRCWFRMRNPTQKVTWQLCGHVKNQNRHISSTAGQSRCKRNACPCQKSSLTSSPKINKKTPTECWDEADHN